MKAIELVKPTLGALLLTFGLAQQVSASSAAIVVNQDGSPTCSTYVKNGLYVEQRFTKIETTDDYPLDDAPYQCISYEIDPNDPSILKHWSTGYCSGYDETTSPKLKDMGMTVLKPKGGSDDPNTFFYAKDTINDDDLQANAAIGTISFCLGVGGSTYQGREEVKDCSEVPGFENVCDALGADQYAVFHRVVGQPANNAYAGPDKYTVTSCTCHKVAFKCDPTAKRGDYNACVHDNCDDFTGSEYAACLKAHQPPEVPVVINHLNDGSSWCTYPDGAGGDTTCGSFFDSWGY
jgi:hypothetical protein